MWEKGHSFDELRTMNLEDFGAVLGYWNEDGRISTKQNRVRKRNKSLAAKG
jgi:hypothetical protein